MDDSALDDLLNDAAELQSNSKTNSIKRQMESAASESRPDSVGQAILKLVTEENYQRAIEELKRYIDSHPEFPQFKERSHRYVNYAIDLVNGIKAKRSLAGVKQLAASKQQELYDRALAHFEDLKQTLRKVEQIEKEVKLDDIRSTVWVVKAVVHCMFALLIFFFVSELSSGALEAAGVLIDDFFGDVVDKIFNSLNL